MALEEGVISSAKANEIATISMDAEDNSGELLLSGGFTISEQLFASIYKEAQKDISVEVPFIQVMDRRSSAYTKSIVCKTR